RNMDEAIENLEAGQLTDAAERQVEVVKGLEGVLKILLEEADNTKERQQEIDRLQAYRDRIEKLLEEERALKTRADAAPRLARMRAAIRAAIARLESLIEKQQKEIEATAAAAGNGQAAEAEKLGEAQKAIRQDTEDVARGLKNPTAPAGQQSDQPVDRPDAEAPAPDAPPDGQPS